MKYNSMKNKKIHLLTFNICMIFFFVTVAFMSVTYYRYGTVEYEDVLKSATVLTRPEVSPENEGKLIIIKGRIKLTKIIRDKDYNEKFKSPSVTRCIEREHRGKTTTWEIESKTEFIGGAKLGSFVLDESVIKDIPHNDERIIKLHITYIT